MVRFDFRISVNFSEEMLFKDWSILNTQISPLLMHLKVIERYNVP